MKNGLLSRVHVRGVNVAVGGEEAIVAVKVAQNRMYSFQEMQSSSIDRSLCEFLMHDLLIVAYLSES